MTNLEWVDKINQDGMEIENRAKLDGFDVFLNNFGHMLKINPYDYDLTNGEDTVTTKDSSNTWVTIKAIDESVGEGLYVQVLEDGELSNECFYIWNDIEDIPTYYGSNSNEDSDYSVLLNYDEDILEEYELLDFYEEAKRNN